MKNACYAAMGFLVMALAACGMDDLPQPPREQPPLRSVQVAVSTASAETSTPKYTYHGDRHRDPFIPLNTDAVLTSSNEEIAVPKLGALILKGIFDDGKQMMAIINSGAVTYILKGTQLYDNRQRLVKGITGIIRKDSVLMIAPDKTTKELKLREK